MNLWSAVLALWMVALLSCSREPTAGAVIDTSTLSAQIQGRSVSALAGRWIQVLDTGIVMDSIRIDASGHFELEYTLGTSISLKTDSLAYYAYRISPVDTIRPSPPLRFLFPGYEFWDSLHPPTLDSGIALTWSSEHHVWSTDSLTPGRHLVTWVVDEVKLQSDLVVHEMGSRFEPHQVNATIPSGSLRPKNCGFAQFSDNANQAAGLGCPHTESDAFNRNGISIADLQAWSDSVLKFQLVTLSNNGLTTNPYSKMLLEFDEDGNAQDLGGFDTLLLNMDLPAGDSLVVRMAQVGSSVARWWETTLVGQGTAQYPILLDTIHLRLPLNNAYPLDLAQIFGLEFRNIRSGRIVDVRLRGLEFR